MIPIARFPLACTDESDFVTAAGARWPDDDEMGSTFDPFDSSGHDETVINPATGWPMIDDSISGLDIGGNYYGEIHSPFDHTHDHDWGPTSTSIDWTAASNRDP